MNTDNGDVGTLEEMQEKYGKDNPSVVPLPPKGCNKQLYTAKNWGLRKRTRYKNVLEEGLSPDDAYDCVENFKGEIQDIHLSNKQTA